MTSENGEPMAITPTDTGAAQATEFKGKGKAPAEQQHAEDASMVEDDDDDEEEEEEAEEVSARATTIMMQTASANILSVQEPEAGTPIPLYHFLRVAR